MTRSDALSAYDDDFYAWTQAQAAALRDIPKQAVDGVDIENVALEIEDLGKRDLREVRSFLRRFIEHMIKLDACGKSTAIFHWRQEARTFHQSALDAYSPSMRQHLNAETIWQDAHKRARADLKDRDISIRQSASPLSLDDLLALDLDLDEILTRIAVASHRD